MPKPLVSVCIVTYQHARFIAQAVEGALMQETDFPVEILIGEDESTDGTREICLDYAKRHPDRIRVFLRNRRDVVNIDGHPRGSYNFRMTLREAQGEYIALCEGDDYWTDPEKLQRQVEYLRANPDCVGCFHDTKLVDAGSQTLLESYFQSEQDKFTQQDVLETLLSREPTCSLVFRKSGFGNALPEWYLRRPSDLYLDILLTGQGSLGFIRRNMGAYRKHAGGIWGGRREADQVVELIIRYKLLLADSFFVEKYRDLLLRKVDELQSSLFTRADSSGEITRLEGVIYEQVNAINAIQSECRRLTTEAETAKAEARTNEKEAQRHIDSLKAQLDHTVANNQTTIDALKAQLERTVADNQTSIDALRAQLDQLAATSRQQSEYIAILEKERDRLSAAGGTLTKESEHYVRVIDEQNLYIKLLEAQRAAIQSVPKK